MKTEKLKAKIGEIGDPRRTEYGNIRHKLWEIIVIALCSTICLGEDYDDMEEFGKEREKWLKEELGMELKHGIPDGDTFERVIRRIKPTELRTKLNESLEYVRELRDIVAIDGKTKRGSGCKSKNRNPIHIISAFACENQLVLGEIASENTRTEIKEIPKLLDEIDVFGSIVTVDSMGCQKEIAAKIIEKDADYVLGLKKNQPKLYEAVESHFASIDLSSHESKLKEEVNGSRIEMREYWLLADIKFLDELPGRDEWVGLSGVGMAYSETEKNGVITSEVRYFITSLTDLNEFAYAVRKHWCIENQLHWCLDVIFREDKSKSGIENAAMNLNILEKHALHLIGNVDLSEFIKMGKPSKKRKRLKAALNTDVLKAVILCGE